MSPQRKAEFARPGAVAEYRIPRPLTRLGILLNAATIRTAFSAPVPELPVADVEASQRHYREALGSRSVIFFRRRSAPFEPAVHWVFAPDLDATYRELQGSGARIVEPLERKPWGLRQFTVEDPDRNRFYFHCD
jgi:hypothetical protein